jgi:hypothetical protein
MESYMHNKEEINSFIGRSRTNGFENVPAKMPTYVNGCLSKNTKQNTKKAFMRIL